MERQWIWILWDLAAVGLIIWSVYKGTKKGFVRSIISAVSYIIAAFMASFLGPKVAAWSYSNLVKPPLEKMVLTAVDQAFAQGAATTGDAIAELPLWVKDYLQPFLEGQGQSVAGLEASTRTSILQAVEAAVREPVTWFLGAILFIVFFGVFAFALRQVARLFGGVNRVPLIGTANMILGGAIGVAQAAAWLFFFSVVISLFVTLTNNELWWLNNEVIGKTYIIGLFYRVLGLGSL